MLLVHLSKSPSVMSYRGEMTPHLLRRPSWGFAGSNGSTEQLDDDFVAAVVVDDFELADVPGALHDLEELDDDLRGRPEEHLLAALSLRVHNAPEGVVEGVESHHGKLRLIFLKLFGFSRFAIS